MRNKKTICFCRFNYSLFFILFYLFFNNKADFIAKFQISLKETAETEYWLRLLVISDTI
ncbi:MAG: four helix bundle protein [Clostridia bacterium]|nr:four helix bundle protein [Clostridia bacterium]